MNASGTTPTHAIKPNVMTHLFRTGSIQGPMKATAEHPQKRVPADCDIIVD
jgi:hypothetical protein